MKCGRKYDRKRRRHFVTVIVFFPEAEGANGAAAAYDATAPSQLISS